MKKNKLSFLVIIFKIAFVFSQNSNIINDLRHYRLDSAYSKTLSLTNSEKQVLEWQISFLKDFKISNSYFETILNIQSPNNSKIGQFYYYINLGDFYFYKYLDKNINALDFYKKALKIGKESKDEELICEALKKILTLHRIIYLYDNKTYNTYLRLYEIHAYDELERAYFNYYNLILNFKNYYTDRWDKQSYTKLQQFLKDNKTPYLKGISYTIFASYYEELKETDSIWDYINKAEKEFKKIKYNYKGSRLNQLYTFKARIAVKGKKTKIAQEALNNSKKEQFNKTDYKANSLAHYYKSVIHTLNKDYKSAYEEYYKYEISKDSLQKFKYNDLLNELETKYQTTEKEKKIVQLLNTNLKSEAQRLKNRNWLIGSSSALILGLLIAILLYKNIKRKQHIAEQEREIEIQKTEKLLKNQELTAIDAMISGQEKERQRLANDLHDNLGSTLATVKLHFDHLKNNRNNPKIENIEELYSKTNNLLDEAYQKVRTIAHEKNSGVMANQGLLPAIKNLAKKASNVDGLQIEVQDYGLDERLDNTLEISIFRMIQELITNTIKHANASEIGISLTNHDSLLNIIVEDNGKGFNAKILPEKDGMGLKSIEKRIEHMEGTFEIDSTIGKGTNIIINIPI